MTVKVWLNMFRYWQDQTCCGNVKSRFSLVTKKEQKRKPLHYPMRVKMKVKNVPLTMFSWWSEATLLTLYYHTVTFQLLPQSKLSKQNCHCLHLSLSVCVIYNIDYINIIIAPVRCLYFFGPCTLHVTAKCLSVITEENGGHLCWPFETWRDITSLVLLEESAPISHFQVIFLFVCLF